MKLLRIAAMSVAGWLALPASLARAGGTPGEGPQAYVDTVSYASANQAYATSAIIYDQSNHAGGQRAWTSALVVMSLVSSKTNGPVSERRYGAIASAEIVRVSSHRRRHGTAP